VRRGQRLQKFRRSCRRHRRRRSRARCASGVRHSRRRCCVRESERPIPVVCSRAVPVNEACVDRTLICKMWSMLTDSKGVSAFPDLGPLGGSINQIPVLVSEGVTAGNVVLVDGSGIAAASGDLVLNEFREGMMQHSKPVLFRWIRGAKAKPETSRSPVLTGARSALTHQRPRLGCGYFKSC